MHILIVDKASYGMLDIVLRAQEAGHKVKHFVRDYSPKDRPVGRGLEDIVKDWRPWMPWADLVIVPENDLYMREMDAWADRGVPIIGGGTGSASWEIDREVGMAALKRADVRVPPYRLFRDYDSAISYVKKQDQPFVSKPCGACDDKSLSYVAKSPEDLVWMLEKAKKLGTRRGLEFILQEKISGVEFAVGGWFGPAGFTTGFEENWEHKKLMPGNLGPNTTEMGTVMRFVRKSRLADMVLLPIEKQLSALGYCGKIDINCIIDEDGTPWPLEFTTRLGWPAFNIEQPLFLVDPMEFLVSLIAGSPPPNSHRWDTISLGVVMALPDWPYSKRPRPEVIGVPIYGLDADVMEHFHPCEVMAGSAPHGENGKIVDSPCLVSAGDYVCVVTGSGDTVREARQKAYRKVDRIKMPASPFYRTDIGSGLARDLPKLQEHGFATGMSFS